jgi:4-hydroxy-3-polyprenylbenzoate decarboxylase
LLLDKLIANKAQWSDLGIIMTENAKTVWSTELENSDYTKYDFTRNHVFINSLSKK